MYNKIILSGGAIKGVGYIGVLKTLEELKIIENLKEFIGTSVGAFFALVLVLNYSYKDLYKIFMEFDSQKILDYKISTLIEDFGLDNGTRLEEFIKIFIKNKGYDENITMKEFYLKTNKILVFASCCVNLKSKVFIDHLTFPDLPVYLGARMSMNIPIIFSPVVYKDHYYIDGCFTCNLPVFYLKEKGDEKNKIFIVMLKNDINNFTPIDNLFSYLTLIPKCSFSTMERECLDYANNVLGSKVLCLDIKKTSDFKFNMSRELKEKIIDESYNSTKKFLINNG